MDLGRVDALTADAVGEPGKRTFYLQARVGASTFTVHVEKQQVDLLATSILELLERSGQETGEGPTDEELRLIPPLDPLWRAGRLSIGYDETQDMLLLEVEELLPEEEEEEEEAGGEGAEEAGREPERLRLWATREQMLALSRHASAVVARGRPLCPFCGNPLDAEGHVCPAMNGHRTPVAE